MNEWAFNPSTVQVFISGVVGLGTLVLLVIVFLGTQAGRISAKAAQDSADVLLKDAELRTRPWLGICDCKITLANEEEDSIEGDLITIYFQNVGAIPAQDAVLSIKSLSNMGDTSEPYTFQDQKIGTIFPREPGNLRISSEILKSWGGSLWPVHSRRRCFEI